jgi:hypothetical protein
VTGLVEYVRAGGGQDNPFMQADTAAALWSLGAEDPAVRAMAPELMEDAVCWAFEVEPESGLSLVARRARSIWGESAWSRMYELTLPRAALPEHLPRRYLAALQALNSLLHEAVADGDLLAKRVRQATKLVLTFRGDSSLQDDLICRLLIVYETLLERRPEIPARVCEYIQYQLARLARDERLRTPRHWELWMEGLKAVGWERLCGVLRATAQGLRHRQELSLATKDRLEDFLSLLELQASSRPNRAAP